ncbi:MAG: PAS domain-containing protein [Candidatus Dormiibacterota bacterium]
MSSLPTAAAVRTPRSRNRGAARALRVLVCAADSPEIVRGLGLPGSTGGIESRASAGPESMPAELDQGWDAVVVADSRSGWSAEAVLDRIAAGGVDIPVVVICDPACESVGLALVERGAADCLTSDRLARLGVAVRAAAEREVARRRLARAEADASGAREMMRVAFDNDPNAVIAVDPQARVLGWNRSAARLLGWSPAEACGRRLADVVGGEELVAPLVEAVSEAATGRVTDRQFAPVKLLRRDGRPVHVAVQATHRRDADAGVVLTLTDMTDRRRFDWLKAHHLAVLRALPSSAEDASFREALEQIAEGVNATGATLWESDPRGGLQVRARWSREGPDPATAPPAPSSPPAFVERAVSTGQLSFSEEGLAGSPGDRLAVPVTNGEQVFGAVEIAAPDFPGFDDSCVTYLTGVGIYLGIHLAQRRSEADFARSLEELNRINGERRRLMRLLVQAHEDERKTIAADIHDDPLQVMAAVSLRLHSLRRRLSDETAQRSLESVEEMVGSTVSRLRSMMFNLRPTGLDRGDLLGPLRERLEQMREDDSIRFTLTGSEPELLTTDGRVALYRIAQEAIANVVKHASATSVDVAVGEQDGGCLIRISDDGAGLSQAGEVRSGHLGLPSIRERAELVGGWLRVEAGERVGTVVSAWVPLMSEPGRAGGRGL